MVSGAAHTNASLFFGLGDLNQRGPRKQCEASYVVGASHAEVSIDAVMLSCLCQLSTVDCGKIMCTAVSSYLYHDIIARVWVDTRYQAPLASWLALLLSLNRTLCSLTSVSVICARASSASWMASTTAGSALGAWTTAFGFTISAFVWFGCGEIPTPTA